jgi:hypothetical protein
MLTVLSVVAGALLVLFVALDVGLTVLHPSARGRLSYAANRATWRLVHAASRRLFRGRMLSYAGPLAMAANVAAWITTLWVGFALIYLPFVGDFPSSSPFGSRGLPEALYASGASLTTVGFGDLVPSTDLLRIVSVIEAGAGLGVFTAAITYVLSVYPLVTAIRASALRLADLGVTEPDGAVLVARNGHSELAQMTTEVVSSHENLRRFPILYYFESGNEDESLATLLRAGATMCIVLQWGVRHDRLEAAAVYGPAVERGATRMFEDLERDYVGGRRRKLEPPDALEPRDAAARYRRLQEYVESAAPELRRDDDTPPEGFGGFVARAESLLNAFAHEHGHGDEKLLQPEPRSLAA